MLQHERSEDTRTRNAALLPYLLFPAPQICFTAKCSCVRETRNGYELLLCDL